ncbi:MAG TPA: ATP synthase subunit I [Arenicellales bacterium]|nr:ATP synthase subunit I [Arenicellales bacterium]
MQHLSSQHARRRAYRIVLSQLAVTGLVGALFSVFGDAQAGVSAWIGGGVVTVATYYQVRIAFSPRHAGDPVRTARAFYVAEVVKILLIAALLALALNWLTLEFLPLMLTFIAALAVFFAALYVDARSDQ